VRAASGQTLLEFTLTSTAVILTLIGSGWVLRAYYERARCVELVFEKTHAALRGAESAPHFAVSIDETAEGVRGSGRCGNAREELALKKLEAIGW
jgi:hypothetical protein